MSSWLKVAEDLFENVDRRAKLVVSELADEQSASQHSATSGQRNKARKVGSKEKAQARNSATGSSKITLEKENKNIEASTSDANINEVKPSPEADSTQDGTEQIAEILSEHLSASSPGNNETNKGTIISETTAPDVNANRSVNEENDSKEAPITNNDVEINNSSVNNDINITNSEDLPEIPSVMSKKAEPINDQQLDDGGRKLSSSTEDATLKVDPIIPASETVEMPKPISDSEKESIVHHESSSNKNKQQETKSNTSETKIQEQLDEAQGLLKSTVSTGQSKEARLSRVCANLSSRLQEYKAENTQLEELLVSERARIILYEAQIKQLQHELSASKLDVERIESNMSAALAAKNSEVESLLGSVDSLKKQASASDEKLASLQENMEAVLRNRDLTETRMMQALREELASAERRAEEEHAAHNATKMAAMEREVELEHRALEASNALARLQRSTDESTERATELEHKVALLEVECASLTQELQDAEARNRRGQKKSTEEANQILQMQAWQEEVERARQAQRDAEHKLSSLEAELQKVRVEMAGMKRDAEHYSRQEHMELEKRYRELTDLLYHKQTQLETMASEKAAAEFQLEKETRRFQEAQVEAEKSKVSRRPSTVWEEDNDIKPLESLPLYQRHLSGASIQLQKAAKMLDTGAVRATRFLWRYPFARIFLLFYLVFVHLFLMHLLHRLQEQADYFSSQELAASMGLRNSTLP